MGKEEVSTTILRSGSGTVDGTSVTKEGDTDIEKSIVDSVQEVLKGENFRRTIKEAIAQALADNAQGGKDSSTLISRVREAVVEAVQQNVSVTPVAASSLSEKVVAERIEETKKALSRDIGISQTKLSTEISQIQGDLNKIRSNIGNIGSITNSVSSLSSQVQKLEKSLSDSVSEKIAQGINTSVSEAIETTVQTRLNNDAIAEKVSEKLSADLKEVSDKEETCKRWARDNGDKISNAVITAIFVVCCLFAGVCSVAAYLMVPQAVAMAGIIVSAILMVCLIIVNWLVAELDWYGDWLWGVWRPVYNSICSVVSIGAMVLGMCALFC